MVVGFRDMLLLLWFRVWLGCTYPVHVPLEFMFSPRTEHNTSLYKMYRMSSEMQMSKRLKIPATDYTILSSLASSRKSHSCDQFISAGNHDPSHDVICNWQPNGLHRDGTAPILIKDDMLQMLKHPIRPQLDIKCVTCHLKIFHVTAFRPSHWTEITWSAISIYTHTCSLILLPL